MRVDIQWAIDPPLGWVTTDSREWNTLSVKPKPPIDRQPIFQDPTNIKTDIVGFTPSTVSIDKELGWIFRLNVQGIVFQGDHICVEEIENNGIRVTVWDDDLGDPGTERKSAQIREFYPEIVETDFGTSKIRGPKQLLERYFQKGDPRAKRKIFTNSGDFFTAKSPVFDFDSNFIPPLGVVRHGIWLLQRQVNALLEFPIASWEEWVK